MTETPLMSDEAASVGLDSAGLVYRMGTPETPPYLPELKAAGFPGRRPSGASF